MNHLRLCGQTLNTTLGLCVSDAGGGYPRFACRVLLPSSRGWRIPPSSVGRSGYRMLESTRVLRIKYDVQLIGFSPGVLRTLQMRMSKLIGLLPLGECPYRGR